MKPHFNYLCNKYFLVDSIEKMIRHGAKRIEIINQHNGIYNILGSLERDRVIDGGGI